MINLTENNNFDFGKGIVNNNADFRVEVSKHDQKQYDFLIFTDSKGTSIGNETGKEWTTLLIKDFESKNLSYLLITRPKEMTVFFTLLNFINLNDLKFKYLITNVGFVDTTPKKEEFIDDIFKQSPFETSQLKKYYLCNYILSSGEIANLYSVDYSKVINNISKMLSESFQSIYLIETFEFSPQISIKRKRPAEFFSQLKKANQFIRSVASNSGNIFTIEGNRYLPEDESNISYDAVHFTGEGHELMYNICKEFINI